MVLQFLRVRKRKKKKKKGERKKGKRKYLRVSFNFHPVAAIEALHSKTEDFGGKIIPNDFLFRIETNA
jgi:hypothetical protein